MPDRKYVLRLTLINYFSSSKTSKSLEDVNKLRRKLTDQ